MINNLVKNNEKIEDLCLDELKIIQSPSLYRFTSDAVILANFIVAKPSDKLLDLGTGSGIIAILATYKNKLKNVVGVEIQSELADMASRSVKLNELENAIKIFNADIKKIQELNLPEFDIIACNPPYKKQNTSKLNQSESDKIARHETTTTLKEICQIASKNLKFGGKFYVCLDSDRTAELLFELKNSKLEPKKMFFTQSSEKSVAKIVFVQAVKGGKESVKILPMIITNDKDGKYLEVVKKMKFE